MEKKTPSKYKVRQENFRRKVRFELKLKEGEGKILKRRGKRIPRQGISVNKDMGRRWRNLGVSSKEPWEVFEVT